MNPVKVGIVVLTSLTLLFGIVAVATNYWLEGCFDLYRYLELFVIGETDDEASAFRNVMKIVNGSKACFASGLFKFEVELTRLSETLHHSDEESEVRQATATLLLIGLIVQGLAAIVAQTGSYQDPSGSRGRSLFVTATVLLGGSMLLLLVGMTVYTALFVEAKRDNPMLFFDQFREGVTGIGMRHPLNYNMSASNFPPIDEDWFEEEVSKVEGDAEVHFGYSIYLGWASCFVSFLNLCTAVYACFRRKRESTPTHIGMS